MALLDHTIVEIVGEKQYYSILARMTLKEAKEFRYHDKFGKEKKLTAKQGLKRVNRLLIRLKQSPYSYDWAEKWWKRF